MMTVDELDKLIREKRASQNNAKDIKEKEEKVLLDYCNNTADCRLCMLYNDACPFIFEDAKAISVDPLASDEIVHSLYLRITEQPIIKSSEAKDIKGKPDYTLLSPAIFKQIEKVREYGNQKYHSPDNWRNVDIEEYHKALLRHAMAIMNDYRSVDPESGLLHLAHIGCNVMFMLQMMEEECHE